MWTVYPNLHRQTVCFQQALTDVQKLCQYAGLTLKMEKTAILPVACALGLSQTGYVSKTAQLRPNCTHGHLSACWDWRFLHFGQLPRGFDLPAKKAGQNDASSRRPVAPLKWPLSWYLVLYLGLYQYFSFYLFTRLNEPAHDPDVVGPDLKQLTQLLLKYVILKGH